jgi:hypothetical protein
MIKFVQVHVNEMDIRLIRTEHHLAQKIYRLTFHLVIGFYFSCSVFVLFTEKDVLPGESPEGSELSERLFPS